MAAVLRSAPGRAGHGERPSASAAPSRPTPITAPAVVIHLPRRRARRWRSRNRAMWSRRARVLSGSSAAPPWPVARPGRSRRSVPQW